MPSRKSKQKKTRKNIKKRYMRRHRGGVKTNASRSRAVSSMNKTYKKETIKSYKGKTSVMRKNNIGNMLTNKLIQHCNEGKWNEYEVIIQKILHDNREGKRDFFEYMNKHIKSLDPHTIFCLEPAFTRLQEEVVDVSMDYINHVWDMKREFPEIRQQVQEQRIQSIKLNM